MPAKEIFEKAKCTFLKFLNMNVMKCVLKRVRRPGFSLACHTVHGQKVRAEEIIKC